MTKYKDNFDWREKLVTHIKGDQTIYGNTYKDGTVIKLSGTVHFKGSKKLSLIIPSMSALFLNISYKEFKKSEKYINITNFENFGLNNDYKNLIKPKNESIFLNFLENRITSIIISVNALDIFLNENIPEGYIYIQINKKKGNKELNKLKIEKLSIGEKLGKVYPDLLKLEKFDLNIWEKYNYLIRLRNRLVHLKSKDLCSSKFDENTIWNNIIDLSMNNPAIIAKEIIIYISSNKHRFIEKIPF